MLLDIQKIRRLLPHRYPILLIDRVLSAWKVNRWSRLKTSLLTNLFSAVIFPIGRSCRAC